MSLLNALDPWNGRLLVAHRNARARSKALLVLALMLGVGELLPRAAHAQPPTFLVSGRITALGPSPVVGGLGTVTLATANGPLTFLVTSQTVIWRNGQPATYQSLRVGDFCKAAVTWNGSLWVASEIWDSSPPANSS